MAFTILKSVKPDMTQLDWLNKAVSPSGRTTLTAEISDSDNRNAAFLAGGKLRYLSSKVTRSAGEIASHNRARQELLLRLGEAYGAERDEMATFDKDGTATFKKDFLKELKDKLGDTLKLKDFGIDLKKGGAVSSGKPLTERRVRTIQVKMAGTKLENREVSPGNTYPPNSFLRYFEQSQKFESIVALVNCERNDGIGDGSYGWNLYNVRNPETKALVEKEETMYLKERKSASKAIASFFVKTQIELKKKLCANPTVFSMNRFAAVKEKEFRDLLVKSGGWTRKNADNFDLSYDYDDDRDSKSGDPV